MSLLVKKRYSIPGVGGDVDVFAAGDRVRVVWYCGDSREFDEQDARWLLDDLKVAERYPDAHLEIRDSGGYRCYATVRDARVHVANYPHDGARSVDLRDLRKAIKRVVRSLR